MPVRTLSVLTCALVVLLGTPVAAATPHLAAVTPDAAAGERVGTLTLISGDHVSVRRVGARLVPVVTPGPGRSHIQFATSGGGDQLNVVPSDAWAELNSGRLDQRLFDVAALLRDGYGDDARPDVPLIVRTAVSAGAMGGSDLSTADLKSVRQRKDTAVDFWNSLRGNGILSEKSDRIWLDGVRRPSLDVSVGQIGAPEAWRSGYTGTGTKVAVLDTGIDLTHPDLLGRVDGFRTFIDNDNIIDKDGHGTHVASTIAGSGQASGGRYRGVAPDARLLVGKVCGGYGCPESAILAGMRWAADSGADVVNLSLGGPDTPEADPLEVAVNELSAQRGTLFVIAAGNDGSYGAETVSSPASADAALAVGAVDREDALASFSSRGPRLRDAALKPEIVAPGVDITAAKSRFVRGGDRKERHTKLSGTSMATPHVAGSAAILAQRYPEWTGQQLKAALMASAKPIAEAGAHEQGAGRVDVARAIGQTVYTEPAAVSLGRQSWPHDDDPQVRKTFSYTNSAATPVTLRLSVTTAGPGGETAPTGMFRLSTDKVAVPARGRAAVEIIADTTSPADEGAFSAWIVAEAGETRVTTPVAIDREPESYDLTLRAVDRDGKLTDANHSFMLGVDISRYRPVATVDGVGTVRVRKGSYHVDSAISTPRPDGVTADSHKVVHPTVDVNADTTVVFDAAAAKPITVSFDRPGVRPKAVGAGYSRFTDDRVVFTGVLGDDLARIHIGQVGDPLPDDVLIADIGGAWAIPDSKGDFTRAATAYHLSWFDYGILPTGWTRHVVDKDLASVATTYRQQAARKSGTKIWLARESRFDTSVGYGLPLVLPIARTELHNVDALRWSTEFQQSAVVGKTTRTETTVSGGQVDHVAGQTYRADWNSAVVSPNITGGQWAGRYTDTLSLQLPLHTDAGADRHGTSLVDSGSTVLYRDGVKIGETEVAGQGSFDVGPEAARYRVETTAVRSGVSEFSTTVSGVWTFTSQRPPEAKAGKEGTPLAMMSVRFTPSGLDDRNRIVADKAQVPLAVSWPRGIAPTELTDLTVDVSHDDGRTWKAVVVERSGAEVVAHIDHPHEARFVSLRAKATDSAGNTVEQTTIRAYGI
ncbi:MAG: S8 family serine peptidase [Actinomycetota bacterium]|nr:S8 family serine peptidase [Actinomycetota bacterium]